MHTHTHIHLHSCNAIEWDDISATAVPLARGQAETLRFPSLSSVSQASTCSGSRSPLSAPHHTAPAAKALNKCSVGFLLNSLVSRESRGPSLAGKAAPAYAESRGGSE